jgi:multiple sugar transport system substrate-binding protein
LSEFENANPGIKINLIYVAVNQYLQKMVTLYAGGSLPDVVCTAPTQGLAKFATEGMFLDLEPLSRATRYDLGQFYPIATKEIGRVNGTLYALFSTMHPGTGGLFYNQDMFDQAGMSYPNDDWTYNDMALGARKLTQRDGSGATTRFGSTSLLEATGVYLGVIQSYGGNLIAADGRTPLLNSPGTVQALEYMRAMSLDNHSAPIRKELAGAASAQFLGGKAAMLVNGYWQQLANVQANPGFIWGAVSVPKGPAGRLSGNANADGWAIAKTTKHPNEAWKVLQWMVGEENQTRLVEMGSNTVSRPRINVMAKYMQNPIHRVFVQLLANQQLLLANLLTNLFS